MDISPDGSIGGILDKAGASAPIARGIGGIARRIDPRASGACASMVDIDGRGLTL
jgi:hypothetical protein